MAHGDDDYAAALAAAAGHSQAWLASLRHRPVGPRLHASDLGGVFGGPLPEAGVPAAEVIDFLATNAEPGLMAMPSGRFFGWVIGGTLPAALASDWLVSAWDQNAGLRYATPATAAIEEAAGQWVLELLGLPSGADVGFVTGATMANFTGMAAARWRLLADAGWDLDRDGLSGAPRIRCFVGRERHDTVDLGLRYLGLGQPAQVDADGQGRLVPEALDAALASGSGPALVCLQAGNLHSGAFDPFPEAIAVARKHGAWVHIDGAFGLWAAAAPELRHLTQGFEEADSWGTDAHKTLNVPYDCGIAIVRDPSALRAAMGLHASYLVLDAEGPGAVPPRAGSAGMGGPEKPGPGRCGGPGGRPGRCGQGHRGGAGGTGRGGGPQRRRLHPGVPGVRGRCHHPGGH